MLTLQKHAYDVPALLQERLNITSSYLNALFLKHHLSESFILLNNDLYECLDLISNDLKYYRYQQVEHHIDYFFQKWIDVPRFDSEVHHAIHQAFSSAVTALIMSYLAVQLSLITYYSVSASLGVCLLFFKVSVKVTTEEFCALGLVNGGIFQYRVSRRIHDGGLRRKKRV